MKLIVMGAGYVGMELLKALQKTAHETFITTTQNEKKDLLNAFGKVLVLDSNCSQQFVNLIEMCDGIIVLVAPKNLQSYESTYLHTAKIIIESLKNRTKPFYILYTSSTSVCEGINSMVTEEQILSPKSENGKVLLETERQYLNCGVDACVLRLGGIYGPKRDLKARAKRFSGKEMEVSGNAWTNHIHLDDIVKGILFCLDNRLKGLYHLVNDDHPKRNELYDRLCVREGIPKPLWKTILNDHSEGYWVSNRKIKDAGFQLTHPYIS